MISARVPLQDQIRAALDAAVRKAGAPGAVAYIGDLEHTHAHVAVGARQLQPETLPAQPDTIYDLASLTKVIATTTAVLLLHERGLLDLEAPVSSLLPFPAFGAFNVRHCLTHSAGLNPGKPFYKELSSIDAMLERYAAIPLSWPPGTRWLYSDVGFMILGRIIEKVSGEQLDEFCAKNIFAPLELRDTVFRPPASLANRCAATEKCPWRGKVMLGEVHDENAYAVGGVAGHAGLFSTAGDIAAYVRALLSEKVLKKSSLDTMCRLGVVATWPWQGLGWQLDAWPTKNFGFLPTRDSLGHAGWTGTSLWIDRRTTRFAVLLSNTCHPSRASRDNESLRRVFHAGIGKIYYPSSANVHTGLDRLVREDFRNLRGKRVALLTHHAAIDQLGRHILDVFALAPEVQLVRLFSPEHGLSGQAEAGAKVGAQRAAVPVTSLYGQRKAPTENELRDIDVFVIDLQDVGARYYTYAATMKACLRACAAARVPVLVLDRPNPVGGLVLEGPVATSSDSMVCWARVPARHGMTFGEIAQFLAKTELRDTDVSVDVSLLDSWTPERYFGECSLTWVPPSPNIPTPETALLYAGTCLFEGCNVNEGRGSDLPFNVIGAPWLEPMRVLREVPSEAAAGIELVPIVYTPRSIPGKAANPRYRGETCKGIRMTILDARKSRPFTLAVALLAALRREHASEFRWEQSIDLLAGTPLLRERIDRGAHPLEIMQEFEADRRAFDAARPKLYVEPIA